MPTPLWVKGQSGNPRGRPPRSQAFSDLMRVELAKPTETGRTLREEIIAKAGQMARNGDLDAMKWLVDRTDGKVADKTEVEGGIDIRVGYAGAPYDLVDAPTPALRAGPRAIRGEAV